MAAARNASDRQYGAAFVMLVHVWLAGWLYVVVVVFAVMSTLRVYELVFCTHTRVRFFMTAIHTQIIHSLDERALVVMFHINCLRLTPRRISACSGFRNGTVRGKKGHTPKKKRCVLPVQFWSDPIEWRTDGRTVKNVVKCSTPKQFAAEYFARDGHSVSLGIRCAMAV